MVNLNFLALCVWSVIPQKFRNDLPVDFWGAALVPLYMLLMSIAVNLPLLRSPFAPSPEMVDMLVRSTLKCRMRYPGNGPAVSEVGKDALVTGYLLLLVLD